MQVQLEIAFFWIRCQFFISDSNSNLGNMTSSFVFGFVVYSNDPVSFFTINLVPLQSFSFLLIFLISIILILQVNAYSHHHIQKVLLFWSSAKMYETIQHIHHLIKSHINCKTNWFSTLLKQFHGWGSWYSLDETLL